MSIELELPGMRLTTGLNAREHWRARAGRVAKERRTVKLAWIAAGIRRAHFTFPVAVVITRRGPRKVDDDNVAGGCKAVRDEIAAALGVDDGDRSKVSWVYQQEKGPFGVLVQIYSTAVVTQGVTQL